MLSKKAHSAEDTLLLAQLREGMRSAFDTLYDKYKADVFNEVYKRLGSVDQAKDVTQDVFIALWTKGADTVIHNLPGYFYIAIRNNVFRLMERQRKFVPIPELLSELKGNSQSADAAVLYKELRTKYEALVDNLPEQQRIIYRLRYDDQLTPEEIAQKLHLSPKTVRNHLGRALTRLKAAFLLAQVIFWMTGK
jgi:RNA polymerase sigma factor (sigma-70 family)